MNLGADACSRGGDELRAGLQGVASRKLTGEG
jgi:hypothetical protein